MSGWIMTLLVGLLFCALAIVAVLVIWSWYEPQDKPGQLPPQQAPKIVIRPRELPRFRTKQIVDQAVLLQQRAQAARTRTVAPPRTTPITVPPTTPAPLPRTTPVPPPRITPQPAPAPLRATPPQTRPEVVQQAPTRAPVAEPAMTFTNERTIRTTRFKIDFDTFCRRTGQPVRSCSCGECREMRADAGFN